MHWLDFQNRAAGLLVFVILLGVYCYTASPTVALGHDTGELMTCSIIQAVPHSPGYPLYVAIGHCFHNWFPFGEPSWRQNIFSAVSVAVGGGVLAAALSLEFGFVSGVVAALLFGFSTFVWRQAVGAEVFGLHLCFLCIFVFLALRWARADDLHRRYILHWTSFLIGCCLAHHHTIALAGPAFLIFGVLKKGRGRPWGFSWLNLPILLLAWIAPYSLQILVSKSQPAINWADPSSLKSCLEHFLRKSYGSLSLNPASKEFDERAGQAHASIFYVSFLRSQLPLPQPLLLVAGLDACFFGRQRPIGFLFVGIALVYGPVFALIGNQPAQEFFLDLLERFYASSMVGWAGLVALGIQSVLCRLSGIRKVLFTVATCSLPLLSFALNFEKSSQRGEYQAYDYMACQMAVIPQNSLYLCLGDLNSGVADYIQLVEHKHPQVTTILPGLIVSGWYTRGLPAMFQKAADSVDGTHEEKINAMIEVAHRKGIPVVSNYTQKELKGEFVDYGVYFQVLPPGSPRPDPESYHRRLVEVLDLMLRWPKRGTMKVSWKKGFWHNYFVEEWARGFESMALLLQSRDPKRARDALAIALDYRENQSIKNWLNHGILSLALKDFATAERDCEEALALEPYNVYAMALLVDVYRVQGNLDKVREWSGRILEVENSKSTRARSH